MTAPPIGGAADLLRGVRPEWDPADPWPLHTSATAALSTFAVERAAEPGQWGQPVVSVHDDLRSLASTALGIRVAPFAGTDGPFDVPLGALMDDASLQRLAEWLGVPAGPDVAYLLVTVAREAASTTHEVLSRPRRRGFERDVHLTAEGQASERKLRPGPRPWGRGGKRLTARTAKRYIDHFATYGTHFVSTVSLGDVLLQAFAFDGATLASLRDGIGWSVAEPSLHGVRALACAALTSPDQCVASGRILSRAGDPALAETLQAGSWDDTRSGATSLLASFTDGRAAAALAHLSAVAPVSFVLTPLNRFLEFFRGVNWQTLLCAALHQRFGGRVTLPVGAGPVTPDQKMLLGQSPGTSPLETHEVVYAERLTARDLARLPAGAESATVLGHRLDLAAGERVRMHGREPIVVVTHLVSVASSTAELPRLVIDDEAFDRFVLLADAVRGALVVADAAGRRQRTIIDGFVVDDVDGAVCVPAVMHDPADVTLTRLEPLLPLALRSAERMLVLGAQQEALALLAWVGRLADASGAGYVARQALALRWAVGSYADRAMRHSGDGRDAYVRTVMRAAEAASTPAGADDVTLRDAHGRAVTAHEAFWDGPPERARTAEEAEASARALAERIDACTPRESLARAVIVGTFDASVAGDLDASMDVGDVQDTQGRAVVPAMAGFAQHLHTTAAALRDGRDLEADGWSVAPPAPADWDVFADDVAVLVGDARSEAFIAAIVAVRSLVDDRADCAARTLSADGETTGRDLPPSLLRAELRLLRAQALAVSRSDRTRQQPALIHA